MDEVATSEVEKTEISSHVPNRSRRLAVRFAILLTAVALGGTYLLSPSPELTMWTSLPVGKSSKRVRVLVPKGRIASGPQNMMRGMACDDYMFMPRDRMPKLVRMILPTRPSSH